MVAALIFLIVAVTGSWASAVGGRIANPEKCSIRNSQTASLQSLVHKAGVFFETEGPEVEDRKTEAEYARENGMTIEEVRSQFGATGQLICNGIDGGREFASANVTIRKDILTTSAHVFQDPKTCKEVVKAENCKFEYKNPSDGAKREMRVERLVASGFECDGPKVIDPYQDWAILKLTGEARVEPYEIPNRALIERLRRGNVNVTTAMGKQDDFFRRDDGGNKFFPGKSIGNNEIVESFEGDRGELLIFTTSADAGNGGSGGGLTTPSDSVKGKRVLAAIHQGATETDDMLKAARESGIVNKGRYKMDVEGNDNWAAFAVPVDGRFRSELERIRTN